jgi:hypothetical protein
VKRCFPCGPKIAGEFHADGWRSRSPFGDLANCATAAGADAVADIQLVNFIAAGWQLDKQAAARSGIFGLAKKPFVHPPETGA